MIDRARVSCGVAAELRSANWWNHNSDAAGMGLVLFLAPILDELEAARRYKEVMCGGSCTLYDVTVAVVDINNAIKATDDTLVKMGGE